MAQIKLSITNTRNGPLEMTVFVPEYTSAGASEVYSDQYLLYGHFQFQIKALYFLNYVQHYNSSNYNGKQPKILISVYFANISENNLSLRFTSRTLKITDAIFSPNLKWHCICQSEILKQFDLSFTQIINDQIPKKLLNDEELTDFELQGKDGCVKVHKSVLAVSSPVLKSMVLHDFKESKQGFVDLSDISKATLQNFKIYMYLQTLPATVSEELLILAMRYMMDDMQSACIDTLVENMNSVKANDLLDFALENKCVKLKLAILNKVKKGLVNINEIEKTLLKEENSEVANPVWKILDTKK